MHGEGVGYLAADEICHGALKPTQAVDATLNSIDAGSFDIARRVRKYIYGGAYPTAYIDGVPTLFGAALTFLFLWYGYQIIFVGTDDRKGTTMLVSTILKAILFGAMLLWLMYYYIPIMKGIDSGINWISSIFLNQGSPPNASSGLATYITYGTQSFVGVTVQFFHLRPAFPTDVGIGNLAPIWGWIESLMLWFFPIVLLIIELILFVGLGILAQVLFALAVAFGPLMLVMSLIPFARRLAQSWGNFLLSAGFYKLVLAAIVGLGGSVFIQAIKLTHDLETTLAQQNPNTPLQNTGGTLVYEALIYAAVCLLLFALILAMFSASRIANHLITGFGTFDIGTAGTGGGQRLGSKRGSGGGGGGSGGSGGNEGERGMSPTAEVTGQVTGGEETQTKTREGGSGERDTPAVVPVDNDGSEDAGGSGDGEGQEQADSSPDAPVDPGVGALSGGADAGSPDSETDEGVESGSPGASRAASGGASEAPVDGSASTNPGGGYQGEGSGVGEAAPEPAPSRSPSDEEGLPTSDEEPPPPRDDEIPPESSDDDRDTTL